MIGTTRHEARRIDNQLRGRAGRQGDPVRSSRFLISLQDDLLVRFGVAGNPDIDSVQRTAESQNLEIRETLWKYETVIEHHRNEVYSLRREVLLSPDWSIASMLSEEQFRDLVAAAGAEVIETAGRMLAFSVIDDLWSGLPCQHRRTARRHPLGDMDRQRSAAYRSSPMRGISTRTFRRRLDDEVAEEGVPPDAEIKDGAICFPDQDRFERGATWTYLTTDQPFGTLGERIAKSVRQNS